MLTEQSPPPVPTVDKSASRVQRMFGEIAARYDFLNHLLSLGIDHYWRWRTVRRVRPEGNWPVLDLCTGTADLALAYHRAAGGRSAIVGADFCRPMLDVGQAKRQRAGADRLSLVVADAERLPFASESFQIVSVAFGLRNVSDTDRGLAEMARVCRTGGSVAVLEFSTPTWQPFRAIYGWYFRHVLPKIGQFLARNPCDAYNYLPESVGQFPQGEALAARMRACGLNPVSRHSLTFGVATLYVGKKSSAAGPIEGEKERDTMLKRLRLILEMIRFSHTLFALPFAMLAGVMAWSESARSADTAPIGWCPWLGILLCMVTARSAAMAFNRLVDRRIDAQNPRTAGRHLPAGLLSTPSVTLFTVAMAIGFVASTLLFLPNRLPLYFAVPVLAFLCGYSFAKRFTSLAHFWLGASLMLAPICAWVALRGAAVAADPTDLLPALVLGGAVLLWVAGFDIIYACQDVDFDRQARLASIPVRLGVPGALRLAAVCHLGMVILLALLPVVFPPLGWIYRGGVLAVAALLIYEHWLVRPDDLTRVNVAFFNVNAVVSIGLLIVGTLDLLI